MRRVFHGKTMEIAIFPSGKDQGDVGMFVEMERNGWKNSLFIPDSTLARVVGREMYYAMICEFFPNDFTTSRPITPQQHQQSPDSPGVNPPPMVFKRIRKRSSNSRIRMTPQEAGVEAEPYDKNIVDAVEQSSQNGDIGEARLRVERAVFQSIQMQDCNFDSAEKLWWDIKYRLSLIIVCLKYRLLKTVNEEASTLLTFSDVFSLWKERSGMSDKEMYFQEDGTLTQIGQTVVESIDSGSILYRLFGSSKAYSLLHDEMMTVQNTNPLPDLDGHSMISLDQSRIIQVVLVLILFGVLIAGVGSFSAENRKIMNMLEKIHEKCKA